MTQEIMRREIVESARKMPRLSRNTTLLLDLVSRSDYDIRDVIELVRHDSTLTLRVLKMANSVALSGITQISSIDRAVLYLGSRMVVAIALKEAAPHFKEKKHKGCPARLEELWSHDLRAAIASREVARASGLEINSDMAFTAGLLHDFGKAVISQYLLDKSPELLELIQEYFVIDSLEKEKELLGTDHSRVGHVVAQSWGLPGSLEMCIRHRHDPLEAPRAYQPLVYIVHVGDALAKFSETGREDESLQYFLDKGFQAFFRLSLDELAIISLRADEEFDRVYRVF